MEMISINTLVALLRHGLFGWCCNCGSPSRYWHDVRARRPPKPAIFDIDLTALAGGGRVRRRDSISGPPAQNATAVRWSTSS
jgi:hypothetical protein